MPPAAAHAHTDVQSATGHCLLAHPFDKESSNALPAGEWIWDFSLILEVADAQDVQVASAKVQEMEEVLETREHSLVRQLIDFVHHASRL